MARAAAWQKCLGVVSLGLVTIGCGLLLDTRPPETPTGGTEDEPNGFLCQAQIYRDVGTEEFTEEWRAWVFPLDQDRDADVDQADGRIVCNAKLGEYVSSAMAPGFAWQTRNLAVTEALATDPDPLLRRGPANECAADSTGPPFTTGGPLGADIVLEDPSDSQALMVISATTDRGTFFAHPPVKRVVWRLAERHGHPGSIPPFAYDRLQRHIRVWDIFVEVETPFDLAGVQVERVHVQGVGTSYGVEVPGLEPEWLLEGGPRTKLFFYGRGRQDDEGAISSFCFARDAPLWATQGADSLFAFILPVRHFEGIPITVSLSMDPFRSGSIPARHYQPHVSLPSVESSALVVDLGGGERDVFLDNDGDLEKVLWFESFETAGERLLGRGLPLRGQPFRPGGHEITAVAYDSRGAYGSGTMTLTVLPPVAQDDVYTTREDLALVVAPSGVLGNDTDARVARVASMVGPPSHGSLVLHLDGSFTYTPFPNFFGADSFTYRVDHSGLAVSNTATVRLTVQERTAAEEANDIRELIPPLIDDGTLNSGQANSLDSKLAEAVDALGRGNITTACNRLQAFINEVNALVPRVLSPEDAQPFLDFARNLRTELGCR